MQDAERRRLEQIVAWRPKHGVISAYFDIDRGDRSDAWRVQLKNGLGELSEPDDHEGKLAVRETVARVLERFDPDNEPPSGRAQVGFVEVAREQGTDDWSSLQISSRESIVKHGPRPLLRPLIDLINRGRAHPVLAVSAERLRGWLWNQGQLEPESAWDAELAIYPGRERKAPAMADPARGQATSSSGRDQFGQRLEDNRKRFLEDFARALNEDGRVRGSELIAIGEAPYLDEFVAGLPSSVDARKMEGQDVINEPEAAIADLVAPEIERALDEREAGLVQTVIDAAMSGGRGAAGINETSEALVEGRVEHLLLAFDGEITLDDLAPPARESIEDADQLGAAELMIELALRTSADVTPVTGDAGEALREHRGAAALLRY
jgi:Bacterial archaeo-eukaryotic release factor family 10